MNNKVIKIILMLCVTLTVFIALISTALAKELKNVTELQNESNIGDVIDRKNFTMSDDEVYCIQHSRADSKNGMYKVHYYLELNPQNVKLWGENNYYKEQNIDENSLVLTYILAASENGSLKRGWDKVNNTQPPRQLALWIYMPTWMEKVGHNLGISNKWDFPFTWDIEESRRKQAQEIIKHGESYAKNSKVEISNAGNIEVEETNNTTIGPIKLKFTQSISEISVIDVDGNTIDSKNITFSSDAEGKKEIKLSEIKSLENFYIQNKSEKSAGNLKIKSKGKVYSAKVWFITHVNANFSTVAGGVGQSHVVVDSSEREQTIELNIKVKEKLANLKILKQDENTQKQLTGAKFKLYFKDTGFVTESNGKYVYNGTESTAKEFSVNEEIKGLEYGVYYIYEVEAPSGYDITKQDGYMNQNGKDPYSYSKDNKWVYLGAVNLTESKDYTFKVSNKEIVSLEGYVWLDEPDTKANIANSVYDNNEKLLEGITVNIYGGNGTKAGTTQTDSTGHYKFENIIYSSLTNAYIEFEYDNKQYIVVDSLVGNNNAINSKAKEREMQVEELEDEKLTGTTGNLPGRAITQIKEGNLQLYYDSSTYKIKDINLGLKEKSKAEHAVTETLEYVKVKMKGYTYTYKYGEDPVTMSTYVPTVNEQNSKATFTAKIYPSDIAYNEANSTDELKVFVVYSIGITNTTTTNIDDIAVEQKLYLTSLTNTFDNARYELSTEANGNSDNENNQFKLWNAQGNKATYSVNDGNSAFKDGMTKNETKTSYIQFRIKEEALEKILTKTLTEGDIENAPTVAETEGFHEYLRTDNVWEDNTNVVKYDGARQSSYTTNNASGDKYYVHKYVKENAKSADLYIRLSLGEQRTISGTVFEDTITEESKNANTNLGNGILEDSEQNRASKVKVELLDSDKKTVSKLYQVENNAIVYQNGNLPDAVVETTVGGTYEFKGAVPGYYYIRFTYGDGSQTMMPASDAIKSSDYKSTIINTQNNNSLIKNAIEATTEQISNAQQELVNNYANEDAKKIVEWYKYLGDAKYSTATDDLEQRKIIDGYTYKEDGTVYDREGKVIPNYKPTNVNSYTPIVGISIENDINNVKEVKEDGADANKPLYDNFNFGIIKALTPKMELQKIITNVTLTNQTGATVVNANPKESDHLLTALDKIDGGSRYAKMEIEESNIYGSDLSVTYKITIKNNSAKDYVEEEGTNEYGYYYKYGDNSHAKEKEVTVNEVLDKLDEKYNIDSILGKNLTETVIRQDKKEETKNNSIKLENQNSTSSTLTNTTANAEGTTTNTTNSFTMSGWTPLKSDESTSVEYSVTTLLSNKDDDTVYSNEAKITAIKLDKLTTLTSGYDWSKDGSDEATIAITPPTGSDRSNLYIIITAIALGTLFAGVVVLKKKVL